MRTKPAAPVTVDAASLPIPERGSPNRAQLLAQLERDGWRLKIRLVGAGCTVEMSLATAARVATGKDGSPDQEDDVLRAAMLKPGEQIVSGDPTCPAGTTILRLRAAA